MSLIVHEDRLKLLTELKDYDEIEKICIEELVQKQSKNEGFGLHRVVDWKIDVENKQLILTTADNWIITSEVEIIGTLDLSNNTWFHAWVNDTIDEKFKSISYSLKEFGEKNGYGFLAAEGLSNWTQKLAWEFTAIALKLTDADGAFMGDPTDHSFSFMIYKILSVNADGPTVYVTPESEDK